jgi:hypothetical protein
MFKKVAFTYYPVTDVARARKFYEETLGLKSGSSGNQVRLRRQSGRAADITAMTESDHPCATWQIDDGFRFAQPILRIRRWNIGAAVITFPL